MDFTFYLDKFNKAVSELDKNILIQKGIEIETGIWLDSVVLRMQKKHWANKPYEKPQSDSAIFFSVWLNEKSLKSNIIFYNIHALRLRQLNGYSITSREFATAFRKKFKQFQRGWSNVSVDFGPLTLMEGWERVDLEHLQEDVLKFANKFLEIDFLIDDLLNNYKLIKKKKQ